MNIAQIEENVNALLSNLKDGTIHPSDFIYELLLAYGHRKQSVTRLRSGERNMSSKDSSPRHDEIIWKRHLYFKQVEGNELHSIIDQMRKDKLVETNKIRFVIVTNFDQILAVDTKTSDSLDIDLSDLTKQFDFFLPWAGREKALYRSENPADVKAAEKMAKLFDLIKDDNFDASNINDTEALHHLNVFLTRLLFCFFAEDTEIFKDNQFSNAIKSHTASDGSDLAGYLDRLFKVLNTSGEKRGELPDYLTDFPYVNGGLFADAIASPTFTAKSRRLLIECGSELDWSDINPDIFGSMIQAVVHSDQRAGMGMHYTSVSNIMRVIEPLFLSNLYDELEKFEGSSIKLQKLHQRLGEIKIFDPACGSGNFLIIAYKELRKLEMEVLKSLHYLELQKTGQISQPFSVIKLSQFYGVELDDFAHEVAILSLWLAEHQMNIEFKVEFGDCSASLPLQKNSGIICGNATRLDWNCVCNNSGEVYVLGNPPYQGAKKQNKDQKLDMSIVFKGSKTYKNLDYISCWFYKASKYIVSGAQAAFVTTNSLVQGDQVSLLWQHISLNDVCISFACQTFKWGNSAKNNAGVSCVVIGLSSIEPEKKYIFTDDMRVEVKNISPYLTDSTNVIVHKRKKPLSQLPEMVYGNMPLESGFLKLEINDYEILVKDFPESKKFIKPLAGGGEFLKGDKRWCLWISDDDLEEAIQIPEISRRIQKVYEFRSVAGEVARTLVNRSHQFRYRHEARESFLLVPCTSSERREFLQVGYYSADYISLNSAQIVYDPPLYLFGILSSRMHMIWTKATAGCLESRIRYSNIICYNNFPIPNLKETDKIKLSELSLKVLSAREDHNNLQIADMYSPEKMPENLRVAHCNLDKAVESFYQINSFKNDEERLSSLFNLYEKLNGAKNA